MLNEIIELNYENLLHYAEAHRLDHIAEPAIAASDALYEYISFSPVNSAMSFVFGTDGYYLRKKFDTAVKECWENLKNEIKTKKPSEETTAQIVQFLNKPDVSNENNEASGNSAMLDNSLQSTEPTDDTETRLREVTQRLETTEAKLREVTQRLRVAENQLRESGLHYTERLQTAERRLEATEAQLSEANLMIGRLIRANNEIDTSEIDTSQIEKIVRRLNG